MATPDFFTRNKRWLLPLIILSVAIFVYMVLGAIRTEVEEEETERLALLVETRPLQLEPKTLQVHSQGLVQPKFQTELVAEVSGTLVRVHDSFVRGGFVAKGELLAEIEPTNYEVLLDNARAGLASAEAALELEKAQSEVARVEWQNIHDTLPPALGLRKPQLAQAEAQVTASRAALRRAEMDVARTQIRAPYDALVTERQVSLGTFVNVGSRLGMLMDTATAEVRLPIANADAAFLPNDGVGARVNLSLGRGQGDAPWQAYIVRSEGVVDTGTRMRYLVAEIPDPYRLQADTTHPLLPFGSYLVASIEGHTLPSTVVVPRAHLSDGRVAIYDEGQLRFKPVTIARFIDGQAIVTEGLADGDQLIVTAIDFPVEGMAVERHNTQQGDTEAEL